ncbi:DUF1307 domain-containing protein [Actinomycetaceae bacterium WB03_NA08]|uniref:DUF1307 domain-containing protein n=1 Tax=Scrofimicrobium canadense TaxID=2652290 RepID=A0A6N7W8R0_9ACTO|nr:YehR family protein [Scrofimicrobium canadense]MSS84822.1 DUF1307 domain-containing protein [Scrofimicrobium canadense]
MLAACASGGSETQTSYSLTQNGTESTIIFYATGDKVTKQAVENTIDYEGSGLADKETAESTLGPLVGQFQGIEGVEHSIEYGDTTAVETMTVDYSVANLQEVAELLGSSYSDTDNASAVSLKKSVELLEKSGYTKVK